MIRVLHIVHAITRGGGLSNMIMNYYRYIDRSRIQFDFLYFRDNENTFQSEIEALGGRCFQMTEPSMSITFLKEREAFFKEHEGEWACIHCHALFASAIFTWVAKRHHVQKSISHSHSHSVGYSTGNPIKILRNVYFTKQANRLGDSRLACSEDAAVFMFGKKALQQGKAIVINNALNLDPYWFDAEVRRKIRQDLGLEGKFVIGHVGGLNVQKNQKFLIDVFYRFQQRHANSTLLLVGGDGIANGSTKQELMGQVSRYGISDKVRFLGFRGDVNAIDQAMDVFVFPSTYEGLGIVLIEAQASGLPCVVSPAIPHEAQVLSTYRVMDNLDCPETWVSAIEASMAVTQAERVIDHMLFENYDIRRQVAKLEQIYSN